MFAKIFLLFVAVAASHASLIGPAVYGHGLAIKAPVAPVYAAPVITKSVIAPAVTVQQVVGHAAPLAYAPVVKAPIAYTTLVKAPVAYATVAKAPIAYTTVAKAPITYTTTYTRTAPVLSHTGLLGTAPLAYAGLAGHGLGYGLGAPALGYGSGLAYGPGLAYGKGGYGKVLY